MYFHGINRQEVPNKSFFLYISLSRQVRYFPYLCIFLSEPLFYCFKSGEIFFKEFIITAENFTDYYSTKSSGKLTKYKRSVARVIAVYNQR